MTYNTIFDSFYRYLTTYAECIPNLKCSLSDTDTRTTLWSNS